MGPGRAWSVDELHRPRHGFTRVFRSGRQATQDTELVALRVGQHHPGDIALTDVGTSGPKADKPLHLVSVRAIDRPQVQVQAVLDRLPFGNGREHQRWDTRSPPYLLSQVRRL